MKPQNQFLTKAQNEQKLEQSIRLMEYINMYNLKKDEITYQCPIYKSQIQDEDFDLEVQCVEQMSDLFIIYRQERKMEFSKIRVEEERLKAEWAKEEQARKKGSGFFSKLFKSQSKDKKEPSASPSKLALKESMMKSGVYVSKFTPNQSLRSSQLKNNTNVTDIKPNPPIMNQEPKKGDLADPEKISDSKVALASGKKQDAPPSSSPSDKKETQNAFNENQLVQIDVEDLLNLKQSNIMSKIEEDDAECSQSIRDSRVSRVSMEDLQKKNEHEETKRRVSKRSRKFDSDEEDALNEPNKVDVAQIKQDAFKKGEKKNKSSEKKSISSSESPKLKIRHSKKNQKSPKKQLQKDGKQSHHKERHPSAKGQDKLSSYIEKQLSRLSVISHRQNDFQDSQIYSLLSSADILTQTDPNNKSVNGGENSKINDSYSDIKIDWFAKIEACQLQQRLLMNRFQNRWNKPLKTLVKIQNLRLSDFTQELNSDPKYRWSRPNLHFGKIIE